MIVQTHCGGHRVDWFQDHELNFDNTVSIPSHLTHFISQGDFLTICLLPSIVNLRCRNKKELDSTY